jgi:antitoxin component YwqK of YwqJK toxin-antitoxin module
MKNLILIVFLFSSVSMMGQTKELRTFFDNGSVKSIYLYTSADNYHVTNYHTNGKIMETGQFVNGKMEGVWTSFNEQAVQIGEASYSDGLRTGDWKMFDASGALRYKITYANNKIVTATNFDQAGKLVAESHSR